MSEGIIALYDSLPLDYLPLPKIGFEQSFVPPEGCVPMLFYLMNKSTVLKRIQHEFEH